MALFYDRSSMSLKLIQINKSFGANRVLKDVSLELIPGSVHALIGENGAGKSTLMNILGGILKPDSGSIELDGRKLQFHKPSDSFDCGIAFIHQELNLINDLTIYENLFIGKELRRGSSPFLDKKTMIARSKTVLERMKIDLDPTQLVAELDAAYKQIVEIARALLFEAKIIIMDEPTTSLTDHEISRVFDLMRELASQGVSIVFISHKLKEVTTICDRYTVLRDGVNVGEGFISDVDEMALARLMVGHDVSTEKLNGSLAVSDCGLKAENLTLEPYYRNISFELHKGEILGFTGLLGDGRSEIFQSIFGFLDGYSGSVTYDGRQYRARSTTKAAKSGIGYIPGNRKENGIIKDLSILENASIVTYEELQKLLIDHKRERRLVEQQRSDLRIKMENADDSITSLSGGNQQKVVLAKWLLAKSKVLIFDNPTQGVDVGAKEDIYNIILKIAAEGTSVVILSSEAQEIMRVCNRALVLYHGNIRGELTGKNLTEHNIMMLATGAATGAEVTNEEA